MKKRIFVYGSLKSGFWNHYLLKDSPLLGDHVTTEGFTLVSCGTFPAAVLYGTTAIHGEVYEVEDSVYDEVRRLESGYQEIQIGTPYGWAYMYVKADKRYLDYRKVPSGNWTKAEENRYRNHTNKS